MSLTRLASFFGLSSDFDFGDLDAQVGRELLEIERLEHLADRLGPDGGGEAVLPELLLRLEVLVLGQQLTVLERRQARLQHDVVFEIENALEILERHVEQQADAARQRLQEPDVRDRRRELDVAHALAPHPRQRHLDAALLADDALVLHALVLAAQALVVLDRPEDARAEQPVALGLEGAVVDGLGLLDLAVGPRQDFFGARDRNPDLVEHLGRGLRAEKIDDFLIHQGLRLEALRRPVPAHLYLAVVSRLSGVSGASRRGRIPAAACASRNGSTRPPPRCRRNRAAAAWNCAGRRSGRASAFP